MPKHKTKNKASICFIDQTWKNGTIWKKNSKKKNFKALPTEWKPINKNCIILQLNGTAIKNSSFNGFQRDIFVQKVLRGTSLCT